MSRLLVSILTCLLAMFATDRPAFSAGDKKVALVVGNSAYAHSVTLPNPAKDAALIARTLREAGFAVIEGIDLDKVAMNEAVDQFAEAAYDADIALVYYAGHGLQVDDQNYLVPVDAQLEKAAQLQSRTISVNYVLSKLPDDPAVSILILDACRDNPLARSLAAALPKSRSSSVANGLAAVQANAQSYGTGGLLIAYATDPGAVAYDGNQENSPYTAALARHLTTPGLEIQSALTRVRAEVSNQTHGQQRPWHNASLAREVFLGGDAHAVDRRELEPKQQAIDPVEVTTWEEASKRNTIAHYEYYLSRFPNGQFAGLARINIGQLRGMVSAAVAPAERTVAPQEMPAEEKDKPATAVTQPVVPTLTLGQPSAGEQSETSPGTASTEAQLELDEQGRIDVQFRLAALDHYSGKFDGSFGKLTRTAIGEWQRVNGLPETTYLSPQQHFLLVSQTETMVDTVRERYEADAKKAAKDATAKVKAKDGPTSRIQKHKQVVSKATKKRQETAENLSKSKVTPKRSTANSKFSPNCVQQYDRQHGRCDVPYKSP